MILNKILSATIVLLLLLGLALPQVPKQQPESRPQQHVFALWHENLSDDAARILTAAPADISSSLSACVRIQSAARFHNAIGRMERLRPLIEPILRAEGIPPNVDAVVLVESGGLINSSSHKGARGLWQLMPATARRYGLAVSGRRDERLNVTKSTLAAAHYLHDLYRRFGDWNLVFAAYNAGEHVIERAMQRVGQRDFFAIQRALPRETRNYVPTVCEAISMLDGDPHTFPRNGPLLDRVSQSLNQ